MYGRSLVAVAIASSLALLPISSQASARTWVQRTGPHGQVLRVSRAQQLPASGANVTVVGRGYDETVGIYVALCVIPKPKQLPSPCGGGADKAGATGASVWVSSNPPPYGVGLAVPFGIDGKFKISLKIGPRIGKKDCRHIKCAIVTRADHTNPDFRGADVFIPVSFTKK